MRPRGRSLLTGQHVVQPQRGDYADFSPCRTGLLARGAFKAGFKRGQDGCRIVEACADHKGESELRAVGRIEVLETCDGRRIQIEEPGSGLLAGGFASELAGTGEASDKIGVGSDEVEERGFSRGFHDVEESGEERIAVGEGSEVPRRFGDPWRAFEEWSDSCYKFVFRKRVDVIYGHGQFPYPSTKRTEPQRDAMTDRFTLRVNGEVVDVCGLHPNTTLLNWLRSRGLTAAKEGCAEGDCGACTVVVIDRNTEGKRCFRAINSCIALLPTLAGKEIWTVEGIGRDGLHPVQAAMVECYGSQCGYCTPGFISSLFEGHYREGIRTIGDLNDHLCGNLCRCTGYRPIRDAAVLAWRNRAGDDFSAMVGEAEPLPAAMDYEGGGGLFFSPETLDGVFDLLEKHPARLLAGGTELGVDVAKLFREYPALVSLRAVRELHVLEVSESHVEIGAGLALTDVMDRVPLPALREMLRWFASRPIRHRATLGGNLVTASPIGDTAPVLMALEATVRIASAHGEREVPLADFFTGYRKTVLAPGEVLRSVRVPLPAGWFASRAFKVSKRREMDISIVSMGIATGRDDAGCLRGVRVALGGVGPTPLLAKRTMEALEGKPWSAETFAEAKRILMTEVTPISDGRGSADFRREVAAELLEKFFHEPEVPQDASPALEALDIRPAPPVLKHESGWRHVTGEAVYVDDAALTRGTLVVWPVVSPHAHARILRCDTSIARGMPGIRAVLTAADVPGVNDIGASRLDEILLADREVAYVGHPVVAIVGDSPEACRAAAARVEIDYEPLESVLTLREAIERDSFHTEVSAIRRGVAAEAISSAPRQLCGELEIGGQEHFYLETQAAWAEPGEDGAVTVHSSTQHPSEIQTIVARVLGAPRHDVVVVSPRMGGGFGGKETQGAGVAALAALACRVTGRACRMRLNRDQDFEITGKRHPFLARYRVGFSEEGRLLGADVELFANGGWSLDLSLPICDRALFHLDNAYYLPAVDFRGRVCKTHLTSQTAFRGFGGPQGMLVIEEILDRVARATGRDPADVRELNLYHGSGETNTTHYGQEIGDNRIRRIWSELRSASRYDERRREILAARARGELRGLALTPVKFGISFTHTPFNQAGALVLIYADGTVQVNHGGTEMGQGLHTKILGVTMRELGLPSEAIRIMHTRTDKVPNTSATAASSGSDLNGAAVRNACEILRERLSAVARELWSEQGIEVTDEIVFADGSLTSGTAVVSFRDVVSAAYQRRVSLSANGFYRTPEIYYDRAAARGRPFYYYACGAAVSEVEVDRFTGQSRLVRVDILHDVGDSLNEGIDRGQIEGGFIQGMGWLTGEELLWNDKGRLLSHGASTYMIPAIGDVPVDFHVRLLPDAAQPGTIHGSKAVGEPPLMLAISVREALRDAVSRPAAAEVPLRVPATCEAVFTALRS